MYARDKTSDPLKTKALKLAFTGKAAYNIKGTTIHSAFSIPIGIYSEQALTRIASKKLDNLRTIYSDLKLLLFDEISLIGRQLMTYTDLSAKSLKNTYTNFFGGLTSS